MKNELNLKSLRAQKARLSAFIGKAGFEIMVILLLIFAVLSVYFFLPGVSSTRGGFIFAGLALLCLALALWDKWDLNKMPASNVPKTLDDIMEPQLLARFQKGKDVTPRLAWQVACKQWQARFLCMHLLLDEETIAHHLSNNSTDMAAVWQSAVDLTNDSKSQDLHAGILAASLMLSSPDAMQFLSHINVKKADILEVESWLSRVNNFLNQPKPYFGGIGRDWTAGYTPTLDRFGVLISRHVEAGAGHFHTLAHGDVLDSIIHDLAQPAGAVALIGEAGTGKTSLIYALAQRLLEGKDKNLEHYQIISLDASAILSAAKDELESIVLTLFAEAAHSRNSIIFLDDARLFFGEGTGSFNLSQVLLPLVQNQSIKLICAFTPDDFQQLKSTNSELISHVAQVVIKEPEPSTVLRILEDTSLTLEGRNKIIVTYQAIKEANRLSSQYMQDLAYPGKAISLLEQALPYCEGKWMTAKSVQEAIEKTKGVKVTTASAPEADILLHLEDMIHKRMVNQERAVKVVASALRRGRAGVANPNRPIGSFLFLGPTGVGKTELARSLAATYFGDEHKMIRLDMSEYQQAGDVERLLDSGGNTSKSLILQMREQPFSVLLLDEIEKGHPNILNLLLQILDEGQLTDSKGHSTSFKNAIIIATSNAGSAEITQKVGAGENLDAFERPLIEKLIAGGQFKPELVNRFDEVVLFRPLNKKELSQVANLMLGEVNKTLADKNITVQLTDAALEKVVDAGYDPEFGARPMRRAIQRMVEDAIAKKVLSGKAQPGNTITLDVKDLSGSI